MSAKPEKLALSLRTRVLLSVCAIAGMNMLIGVVAFLTTVYLIPVWQVPFAAAVVTSSVFTVLFGRWLAGEVLRPIDKVALAAKTLERNVSAPIAVSTGTSETDELLRSIDRNSKQLNNLMVLMEDVAAGKTQTAAVPFEHSDRLSASFQKLVSKVTDSIDAKNELEEMRLALSRLSNDVAAAASGVADVEIRADSPRTSEIAAQLNTLLRRLDRASRSLASGMHGSRNELESIRAQISEARQREHSATGALNGLLAAKKGSPDRLRQVFQSTAELKNAGRELPELDSAFAGLSELSKRLAALRTYTNDLQRRFRNLRERVQAIPQSTRLAEDLSRRSKMVALNASIRANGRNGSAATAFADEFVQISERAEKLQKELSGIDKTIVDELSDSDSAVQLMLSEIAEVLIQTASATETVSKIEPLVEAATKLPAKIESLSAAYETEREEEMRRLTSIYFDLNSNADHFGEAEQSLARLSDSLRDLSSSAPRAAQAGASDLLQATGDDDLDAPPAYENRMAEPLMETLELPGEN